jgi:hypothetical protein
MPFLFVEQLVVQAPPGIAGGGGVTGTGRPFAPAVGGVGPVAGKQA